MSEKYQQIYVSFQIVRPSRQSFFFKGLFCFFILCLGKNLSTIGSAQVIYLQYRRIISTTAYLLQCMPDKLTNLNIMAESFVEVAAL